MNRQFSALLKFSSIKHENVAVKEQRLSKLYCHSFLKLAPYYFMRLIEKTVVLLDINFSKKCFFVLKNFEHLRRCLRAPSVKKTR